jgi:hypothetical protein
MSFYNPPPSIQELDITLQSAGDPKHTNPSHLQETAAAASAETGPIDFHDMAAEQNTCPETQRLIAGSSSLKIEVQDIQGHRLAGLTSTGV